MPLVRAEHRDIGGDIGRSLVAHAAKVRRRNGKDDGLGAFERLGQVRRGDNGFRQLVVHQISGITVLTVNAGCRLLAMGPYGQRARLARRQRPATAVPQEPEPISATFMTLSYLSSGSVTRLVNEAWTPYRS